MEYILGFVIILIILLILGVGANVIIFAFICLLALATGITELFFLFFTARLLLSKKTEGVFARIDRPEKSRFDAVYYNTADGEMPNVFPAEFVMREKLYRTDKKVKLRADRFRKVVFDRNARLTICFGTYICTVLCVLFAVYLPNIVMFAG